MIILKEMETPNCCAECYTKGISKLVDCTLFNDCHSLIERNYDCPLIEIGICKNCKYRDKKYEGNFYECVKHDGVFENTFYCKDFKKRDSEDEEDE